MAVISPKQRIAAMMSHGDTARCREADSPPARRLLCPTCGYNLGFEPWRDDIPSHRICPSCGIHFGYDDVPAASGLQGTRAEIYRLWRKRWIEGGMEWFSRSRQPPTDWEPRQQLRKIGFDLA